MPSELNRYTFTDEVIASTIEVLSRGQVVYDLKGQPAHLANTLTNPIIPNVIDSTIHLPKSQLETEGTPIIAVMPGESVRLGNGFDSQSPLERSQSVATFVKWGAEVAVAEKLVEQLSQDFRQLSGLGAVSFSEHSEASTLAPSLGFDMNTTRERYGLVHGPASKLGRIVGRNVILLQMNENLLDNPQIISHELAHFLERTNNPIVATSSQQASDMRALRAELKAYQVGARVYMLHNNLVSIGEKEMDHVSRSSQLRVEFIRANMNRGDSDPFRTTPELIQELGKAGMGMEHILHGRIDVEQLLGSLPQISSSTP